MDKSFVYASNEEVGKLLTELFPICRSITGDGIRETFDIIKKIIPINEVSYPSGKSVFDWTIPQEWNVKDAWIKNEKGEKIVDFKECNVHLMSYSIPTHQKLDFESLQEHLFTLPDLPDAIPYRTSYYHRNWAFCVSENQLKDKFNKDQSYEVFIDSSLEDGELLIGELLIPGTSSEEILISTYCCHPSLANDNLSGVVATTFIAKELLKRKSHYSYRIVFIPETIGAIAYSAHNLEEVKAAKLGLIVTTCGGPGETGYKQSFDINHEINAFIESMFNDLEIDFKTLPYDNHGSDERQYSSPGIRLNCVTISKDKYYDYNYYHTSLDNLDFVKSENLNLSIHLYLELIERLEVNQVYERLEPCGEIMLSKHDLYPKLGGNMLPGMNTEDELDIILSLLFHFDGKKSLFEIANLIKKKFKDIKNVTQHLLNKNIIRLSSGN
jgi:aminopeptidase-like protein